MPPKQNFPRLSSHPPPTQAEWATHSPKESFFQKKSMPQQKEGWRKEFMYIN